MTESNSKPWGSAWFLSHGPERTTKAGEETIRWRTNPVLVARLRGRMAEWEMRWQATEFSKRTAAWQAAEKAAKEAAKAEGREHEPDMEGLFAVGNEASDEERAIRLARDAAGFDVIAEEMVLAIVTPDGDERAFDPEQGKQRAYYDALWEIREALLGEFA